MRFERFLNAALPAAPVAILSGTGQSARVLGVVLMVPGD
jgi:hypothetical protein